MVRMTTTAKAIEARREALGLSKRGLASRAGMDHTTLIRKLTGRPSFLVEEVVALAEALDCDVTELLTPPTEGAA